MEAKVYNNTIEVFTFLEHIFFGFCVRYKVFSVYCTLSQTEKSSVKKEDFRLKWDLMCQKTFFLFWKLKFNSIQFGSIHFRVIFMMFLSLLRWNTPKAWFFLWAIYIRLCWLNVHNQQDNNILGHKINWILAIFVLVKRYMKKTAPKIVFFGVLTLILSRT